MQGEAKPADETRAETRRRREERRKVEEKRSARRTSGVVRCCEYPFDRLKAELRIGPFGGVGDPRRARRKEEWSPLRATSELLRVQLRNLRRARNMAARSISRSEMATFCDAGFTDPAVVNNSR